MNETSAVSQWKAALECPSGVNPVQRKSDSFAVCSRLKAINAIVCPIRMNESRTTSLLVVILKIVSESFFSNLRLSRNTMAPPRANITPQTKDKKMRQWSWHQFQSLQKTENPLRRMAENQ